MKNRVLNMVSLSALFGASWLLGLAIANKIGWGFISGMSICVVGYAISHWTVFGREVIPKKKNRYKVDAWDLDKIVELKFTAQCAVIESFRFSNSRKWLDRLQELSGMLIYYSEIYALSCHVSMTCEMIRGAHNDDDDLLALMRSTLNKYRDLIAVLDEII